MPTDSTSTSQISRRRAAGHSAQRIARIADSGPRTTTKWLSRIWAGRPLTVVTVVMGQWDHADEAYETSAFTLAAADSGIGS